VALRLFVIYAMPYAFRVLRKNPSFTVAVAITLAPGAGANAAIFSVLNTMLLRALPFRCD